MKMKFLTLLMFTGLFGAVSYTPLHAQTYDVYNDFSISNGNPNGVWTYGYSSTLTSSLTLYTTGRINNGNNEWVDLNNNISGDPLVASNPDSVPHNLVPPMSAAFHPGAAGEFSHFVWTAPSSSLFSINATFTPLDFGGTDVHILHNGVSLFAADVTPNNPQSYSTTTPLAVLAGDKIDFAVGTGPNQNYAFDSTGIAASLTQVPEPNSTLLGLCGMAILLAKRYYKKRGSV